VQLVCISVAELCDRPAEVGRETADARHTLTADFFDAEKFPSASFISQQVIPTGPGTCTI
jgi:hypothetical protein